MVVEEVLLPSQGIIYNGQVGSRVKVRPFNTREYKDLITSSSGVNVSALLNKCLQDCPLKADQFCSADKLAILFKIRSLTLGSQMSTINTCPYCQVKRDIPWDINKLKVRFLETEQYPFQIELPISKEKVGIIVPTDESIERVKREAERRAMKFSISISEVLPMMQVASLLVISGKNDLVSKMEWYEKLNIEDAMFIDEVVSESQNFGVEVISLVSCDSCGNDFRAILNTSDGLFRSHRPRPEFIKTSTGTLEDGPTATTDVE